MSHRARRVALRTGRRDVLAERLRAAIQDLVADGRSFTELTVDEIIAAAAVSRSSFYKAFGSKGDLLCAWMDELIDDIDRSADAWFTLGPDVTPQAVAAALREVVAAYAPHGVVMTAADESAHVDPEVQRRIDDLFVRGLSGLRRHITTGQRGGWVDPSLAENETAMWVSAMLERGFQQLRDITDATAVDAALAAHADLVWHALYAPVSPADRGA